MVIPHCRPTTHGKVTRGVDVALHIAFNSAMNVERKPELHPDAELIDQLGGPAAVADQLGIKSKHRVQRVQNWKYRGIPPFIRVTRVDVFGPAPEQGERAEAA